jgi:NAD(P)-dependent dehydrogenase (short-subunit alcohol dehydrogenase family)
MTMQQQQTGQDELNEGTDPREMEPKPPYENQEKQPYPGTEAGMTPTADHGETSYKGSGKLAGKVALITGADSGIGRAVALAFAREGADVVISYLSEHEDAQQTERLVTDAGRKALTVPGDIQDEAHCRRLVQQTVQQFGKLDILVNNAAYQKSMEFSELTLAEIERTFRTNLFAMMLLSKFALEPGNMGPGGAIINTASIQAYQPSDNLIAYAATKAAIVNFTKTLASTAAKQGVRVNCVAPGPIWTPLIPSTMPEEKVKSFGQDTPIGRAGQPKELAPIYVLLASDEASYMTGCVYPVTGGEPTM